jgi:glycosyltransferase involved in cell wall biosynthesis
VVIPVHNAGDFLGQALDSLLDQEEPPAQVVVIDDGSTDDSVDIARTKLSTLPLEIVRLGGRSGVSAARNAALARLHTHLVGFLDADDFWLPAHIRVTVDAYLRHGGLISPGALLWYPDGSTRSYQRWLDIRVPRGNRQLPALLKHNFVFVGALLPLADVVAVGGFREPNVGEDWDLWIRLLARGLRVTQLDEATVLYRRHDANVTADRAELIPSIVEILERAERELGELYEPAVRRSISRHLTELELEQRLAESQEGARLPWSAVRAGLRGPRRQRAKVLAYGLAPGLARRFSPAGRSPDRAAPPTPAPPGEPPGTGSPDSPTR